MLIQSDGLSSKNIKKPIKENKEEKIKNRGICLFTICVTKYFSPNLIARIKIDVERKTGKIDSLVW